MKIIFILVVLVILGICLLLLLNEKIKRTNYYLNQNPCLKKYQNGIEKQLEAVNLGSTYARYAFGNYDGISNKSFNFAINHQSLEMDYNILKNYSSKLKRGSLVFIVVSICTFLYIEKEGKDIYYDILKKSNNPFYNFRQAIRRKLPIIFKPKMVKKIVKDDADYVGLYHQGVCIDKIQAQRNMDNLVKIWMELFGISSFSEPLIGLDNEKNIKYNMNVVEEMVEYCRDNQFTPIIVIPPISKKLKDYFSDEVVEKILYDNIEKIVLNNQVQVFDYLQDISFIEEMHLFSDGGYCLSHRGNEKFLNKVFSDIKGDKVDFLQDS